ncbi:unnamed protein product, partial [Discosporangium mesarthrocarpum]
GETVAIPLWVRGRGGGRQTLRMLLRYKRSLSVTEGTDADGVEREVALEGEGGEEGHTSAGKAVQSFERYSPLCVEMSVLPSLSVSANVLPSYSHRGEYFLSLEATNYRSNGDERGGKREINIYKVCAISRCWNMEPLAGFMGAESSGGGGGRPGLGQGGAGTTVKWQERVTLHFRLFPVD